MKIVLSGKIGSGKSVVAKSIAKEFNLKHYSTGDVMREIAQEKGFSIEEFDTKTPIDIDHLVDNKSKEIGEREDNFIFDSKMAWHFIPSATSVFLDVVDEIGAQRIYYNQRDSEDKTYSIDEQMEKNKKRWETHRKRMQDLYGVDLADLSNYDLVIDTTHLTLNEVIQEVTRIVRTLQ